MKGKISLFAVIVVLMSVLGVGMVWAQPSKAVLNVSYNPMPLNVPSIVAKHKGLLETELASQGVKVVYRPFTAGYQMTEAMAAGELDIAPVMGGTSTITSAAGGRDLKIIGAYGQSPAGFAVVTKIDSTIAEVTDLVGKRIALPVGTEVHYLLAKLLEQAGSSLADVNVVNMLVPDAVNALLAGHVDAAMAVEPVMTKLAAGKKIKVVSSGAGVFAGMTLMTASEQLVSEYPHLVDAFIRAHEAAIVYMQQHPEETVELVAKETNLPAALVSRIMPKYTFATDIDETAIASLQDTAEFLFANQITKRPVDVRDLLWR